MQDFLKTPIDRPLAVTIAGAGVCLLSLVTVAMGNPIFGCLGIVAGIAVLQLHAWGRDLAEVLLALRALGSVLGLVRAFSQFAFTNVALHLLFLALAVAGLVVLRRPDVRAAFVVAANVRRMGR